MRSRLTIALYVSSSHLVADLRRRGLRFPGLSVRSRNAYCHTQSFVVEPPAPKSYFFARVIAAADPLVYLPCPDHTPIVPLPYFSLPNQDIGNRQGIMAPHDY